MATLVNHSPAAPSGGAPCRHLFVTSIRVEPVELAERVPNFPAAVWLHRGDGFLAAGVACELTAGGPDRFEDLSEQFQRLALASTVDDRAALRGSGLVCFGSFSYADSSARPSRLLIPQAVLATSGADAFLTLISTSPIDEAQLEVDRWFPLVDAPAQHTAHGDVVSVEPAHTPDEYQALVDTAVARIRSSDADKLVISERLEVELDKPASRAVLARRLADMFPMTWVYAVADVIGASPEMLVETHGTRLFSRVLAGTRPVADGQELSEQERAAFHADPKERAEHEFAIRSVTEPLEAVTAWIDAPAAPFVLRLPGLEHLASDVQAELLPGRTSVDIAGLLHPSAAVSGTPKAAANRINAEIEDTDRGGYAAPVGWMSARGDGEWAIALRMAHVVDEHRLILQAGGGIVDGSDALTEHAEVLAKTRPMMRALRGDE